MNDAIAFLLILPALVLGMVLLDAAGTLGTARYRTSTFAEAATQHAADTLASPGGTDPSAHGRWVEMVATIEQSGLAATAGVCNQADTAFNIRLISQPAPAHSSGASPTVATVVSCPVSLGSLLSITRVVAASVETVG